MEPLNIRCLNARFDFISFSEKKTTKLCKPMQWDVEDLSVFEETFHQEMYAHAKDNEKQQSCV